MSDHTFGARLQHAWSAFINPRDHPSGEYSFGYSYRPDRQRLKFGNERSIVTAIYNRISMDVAAVAIKHVKLDQNGRFKEEIKSPINSCLNLNANIDQTGRAFIQDLVLSMLDEGCVCVVPTNTNTDIHTLATSIEELRVAKIIEWYPSDVKVECYNELIGKKVEIVLPKASVGIIENPFYSIMNESNSTLRRLIRKLALLDITDENNSSGKLDMIIQLPYVIKSEARRKQAEQRRADIEMQLAGSKYGIAYTDGTERITQLNRPVENQLMNQIEYLQKTLYSQLGISEEILNGTANEQTLLNYNNQVIEPILSAIVNEFNWKFLTENARSRGQAFMFFKDPFKLVPVGNIAEIADKFTRNEILSSNEVRGLIGFMPVNDQRADELRNKNLNQSAEAAMPPLAQDEGDDSNQNGSYNFLTNEKGHNE